MGELKAKARSDATLWLKSFPEPYWINKKELKCLTDKVEIPVDLYMLDDEESILSIYRRSKKHAPQLK